MSVTTVRISPPKPPKTRRAKKTAPTPGEELGRFFRRSRVAWIPYMIALWVLLGTAIIAEDSTALGKVWLTAGTCIGLLWWKGHMIGAIRPIERQYAFSLPVIAALWATYATWNGSSVSLHEAGVLVCVATLSASPWWRHRRNRGTVPVTFHHLPRTVRDLRMRELRRLTHGWTAYTSAGHIQGAKLRSVEFTGFSVAIGVRLRNGAHAGQLQTIRRKAHLESASLWPVAPGSVRIQQDDHDARNCTIRYMLKDPHDEPIIPDEDENPDVENLVFGVFETGADVLFALVNTLIAGETGAGKSGVVNRLVQLFAKIPTIGILGVDLTPGATELGPWRNVLHALANTPDDLKALFEAVLNEMERRGSIMEQHGWKKFRCTEQDPFMVLIIDEAQRVKELKLNKYLKRIASEIRKYGGCVIVATQYPKSTALDSDITINLPQKIGMKVFSETADRVIFGNAATRLGWSPSVLIPEGREGSFLIKSKHYGKPLLARCHYVDENAVERDAERFAPVRTAIPTVSLRPVSASPVEPQEAIESGPADGNEEIFEAEILDDTETIILDLIERGIGTPAAIQNELASYGIEITVRTVNRHLKSMKDRDLIYQLRSRGSWHRRA